MKKISKVLKDFVEQARKTDEYWVEAAKLRFAVSLDHQRVRAGLTYKEVSEKLKTSAAYISKVFRGDSNVTIESMVKLARATGARLEIRVIDESEESFNWEVKDYVSALENVNTHKPLSIGRGGATVYSFPNAVNDPNCDLDRYAA
ncbi:helix-turn-helix domain-containing protein [Comamonas sp. B-9]|uniref:helix-turn-helix domain-containing protein n=1 Tax=Comamonas sp. B-9 TaxID=1055192 RepID=UPI00130EF9D4|nr:helix-turn-helix transcriptional regulator [Comamonas sp. B-9]